MRCNVSYSSFSQEEAAAAELAPTGTRPTPAKAAKPVAASAEDAPDGGGDASDAWASALAPLHGGKAIPSVLSVQRVPGVGTAAPASSGGAHGGRDKSGEQQGGSGGGKRGRHGGDDSDGGAPGGRKGGKRQHRGHHKDRPRP